MWEKKWFQVHQKTYTCSGYLKRCPCPLEVGDRGEGICIKSQKNSRGSLVAQTVNNLPAVQETWIRSLGQEDPLEEGMAIHSSILAWRISWIEEPGRLQSMGLPRVRHHWMTEQQQQLIKGLGNSWKGKQMAFDRDLRRRSHRNLVT